MKKAWVTLALILVVLCLVAAVGKIDSPNRTGGGSGGSSGSGSSGELDSPGQYSWIDPATGFDIFDYENVLTLAEGQDCDILIDGAVFEGGSAILHADGSIDLPASLETVDSFTVDLGSYTLDSGCLYYFYYARQYDGEYERCGLGYEDAMGDGYEIDFKVESWSGGVSDYGVYEPYGSGSNFYFSVRQGNVGTTPSVNAGTFYLRVIAVPK